LKEFKIESKNIPMNDQYDVIIVGGGPSGCAAAIASSREGAKTLLVEASGMLGGAATLNLVNAWTPFSDGEKVIYGGLASRILEATKSHMPHIDSKMTDWVPIDYEALKVIYDSFVTDAGAKVLFNSMLCSVEMTDVDTVECIVVCNKAGMTAYKAKVYVDCTGDADLCAWAGAEFEKGDNSGELQPATHCFILSNVDEYGYYNGVTMRPENPESPVYKMVADKNYKIPDTHLCHSFIGPRTMGFNAGHVWNVDNTDPESSSVANMIGRKLAVDFRDALAKYHPKAFANAYLVSTASNIGVRETRRILGDYRFNLEDYLRKASFSDEICRNNYFIDIHNTPEETQKHKKDTVWHSDNRYEPYKKGESHGIPYRCLTPKGLTNVLVAGRSISCDRITQGSVRIMPACLCMGEAAGLAAKLASDLDLIDVHQVDTQLLRRRLIEEGAYLPKLSTDNF
jgi:hypothetical protein